MALVLGLAVLPAWGGTINLLDSVWAPANGLSTYTLYNVLPGLDLTISASGGAGTLWWDANDGFGVRGGENDEIDYGETLTLSFSQPVTLNSFTLYDLFKEPDDRGRYYKERGYADLDPGPIVKFRADPSQTPGTSGYKLVTVGTGGVSEVRFYAKKPGKHGRDHDYSLGGLEVIGGSSAVPEPGTLLLAGSALLGGLGLWRRRRA